MYSKVSSSTRQACQNSKRCNHIVKERVKDNDISSLVIPIISIPSAHRNVNDFNEVLPNSFSWYHFLQIDNYKNPY